MTVICYYLIHSLSPVAIITVDEKAVQYNETKHFEKQKSKHDRLVLLYQADD